MYSNTLKPEIMKTMLSKDFPADELSQPAYGVKVEKDAHDPDAGWDQARGQNYRPDASGQFPALSVADSYQKDLYHLPPVPTFHMRETNDLEWFAARDTSWCTPDPVAPGTHLRESGGS